MNNFYKKYQSYGNWFNILLLLSVLLPLVFLSKYNHPSPADDFCYIDTVFKIGWFDAMDLYYTTWTGRYFGILLNHSNPLLWHSFVGFKILPIILLVGFVACIYALIRQLTPALSKQAHLGFSGVVFFLYILKMASISESFYWMASFVTYTIPNMLTLLWVVAVLKWYNKDQGKGKIGLSLFAGFCMFAVIGSSETNLLIIMLLLAGWWGYRILFQRKLDAFMFAMLGVGLLSSYLYFSSTGNQARISGNPLGGNIPFSLISSFKKLAFLSIEWLTETPILLFSVIWLIILAQLPAAKRKYFMVPGWYSIVVTIGILSAQLFPSYYGVGIEPTPRVINCVYLYFLLGWFYNLGVLFQYIESSIRKLLQWTESKFPYFALFTLIVIGSSFLASRNVRYICMDILKGTAANYSQELDKRYETILASKEQIVYLPTLQHVPLTLYVDDITTNREHWWNKCLAGYFGKEAIIIKKENDE
jgi:hypothetical protein